MRVIGVAAAVCLSATVLIDGARADGKDDAAAQTCLDQFYAATKKGDAAAMSVLLEPAERKAAKSDRDKPDAWPDGSKWTTLHRHVEGDWGLFWVKIDFGPSKEPARFGLSEAEVAVLRRGYSATEPVLLHRVDGEWCFAFAGFAPAEIDEIFHGRPERAPPWILRDYLDWVVDSWRKSPETHPIELDKTSGLVEVSPETPAAFLVELTKIVRLRAVVTSQDDVEPSVSIELPAGGSYGSSGTKRRAVGTCQLTTGAILLVVRTKHAGTVIVDASAAPDPVQVGVGTPAGPYRLRPADTGEFRVTVPDPVDVAFAAMPLDGRAGADGFGVTAVTYRTSSSGRDLASESGQGGLATTAHVEKSAVFKIRSSRDVDVDILVAAVPATGAADLAAGSPVEVSVTPDHPKFLRLAAGDADAPIELSSDPADADAAFVRFAAGEGPRRVDGVVIYARAAARVRVTLGPRPR